MVSTLKTVDDKTATIVSSVHDYRMKRRGSIQSIADALRRAGWKVNFVSIRFSGISYFKRDPRWFLRARSNKPELFSGINCYLWWTLIHPFSTGNAVINKLITPLHSLYARWPNRQLDEIFKSSNLVVVESGLGVILVDRIKRLNAKASIVYRASDVLATIGAHPHLQAELERSADAYTAFFLLAPKMLEHFTWASPRAIPLPLGYGPVEPVLESKNPYSTRCNAVSVGSMLFDASFFQIASEFFPSVTFHVIGPGIHFEAPENVKVYEEMPYIATLPFLRYADFGIAPYRWSPAATYLSESSLKLLQYEALGLPAVCPTFAAGDYKTRFGYEIGNQASIRSAIESALRSPRGTPSIRLTWDETVAVMLREIEKGAVWD